MKHIFSLAWLMMALCLVGCSEEDVPQSVAFSVKEISVGPDAVRMSITIEANCPWTVTDEKDKTFTEFKSGNGTTETPFIVFTNPDYEQRQYRVTVTSEDGTSSDVLVVNQSEQIGLKIDETSLIVADGGLIQIPVKTNDEIVEVKTPDWMSFSESRGLTSYTYSFDAEPNKTGSPRSGYIELIGTKTKERIRVEQDSYTPTGVDLATLPEVIPVTGMLEHGRWIDQSFPISLIPEYADWNKLSVNTVDKDKCQVLIQDSSLVVRFNNSYTKPVSAIGFDFYGGDSAISSGSFTCVKDDMKPSEKITTYFGDSFKASADGTPEEYIKIELPDNKGISYIGDFRFLAERPGVYTIGMESKVSGRKKSIEVDVQKYEVSVTATARQSFYPTIWIVSFDGWVRGKEISDYLTCFIDKGSSLQTPLNRKEVKNQDGKYATNEMTENIVAYSMEELKEKVEKYHFCFHGYVNGELTEIEVPVVLKD